MNEACKSTLASSVISLIQFSPQVGNSQLGMARGCKQRLHLYSNKSGKKLASRRPNDCKDLRKLAIKSKHSLLFSRFPPSRQQFRQLLIYLLSANSSAILRTLPTLGQSNEIELSSPGRFVSALLVGKSESAHLLNGPSTCSSKSR